MFNNNFKKYFWTILLVIIAVWILSSFLIEFHSFFIIVPYILCVTFFLLMIIKTIYDYRRYRQDKRHALLPLSEKELDFYKKEFKKNKINFIIKLILYSTICVLFVVYLIFMLK